MEKSLYLFTIVLLYAEPKIWRRFHVPSTMNLERFHEIIQIVMGWYNYHLYEFIVKGRRFMPGDVDGEALEPCEHRLADVVSRKGEVMGYCYDMGDNWEHKIKLDDPNFIPPDAKRKIRCLDGARACPPEDTGGVPGYFHFCEVVADPAHEDYEQLNEWSG
ncbi:MAG: plasmid pRiA4b ORF-3 family protein, partial [Planctomycetota bacterium]|nr:plasmid pRiA4b ORF-3 family protein [Planctomycetota bacterium]